MKAESVIWLSIWLEWKLKTFSTLIGHTFWSSAKKTEARPHVQEKQICEKAYNGVMPS